MITRRDLLIGTALVAGLMGACVLVVWLLTLPGWTFGSTGGSGTTRLTLGLTVVGAVQGVVMLVLLFSIGVSDQRGTAEWSPLFLPMVAVKVTIMFVIGLAAVGAVDMLAHNGHREWDVLTNPAVILFGRLVYLAFFASLGWLLVVILHGRGWRPWTLLALYLGITVVTAVILTAAFAIL